MRLIIQGIPKNFQNIKDKEQKIEIEKLDLSNAMQLKVFDKSK